MHIYICIMRIYTHRTWWVQNKLHNTNSLKNSSNYEMMYNIFDFFPHSYHQFSKIFLHCFSRLWKAPEKLFLLRILMTPSILFWTHRGAVSGMPAPSSKSGNRKKFSMWKFRRLEVGVLSGWNFGQSRGNPSFVPGEESLPRGQVKPFHTGQNFWMALIMLSILIATSLVM